MISKQLNVGDNTLRKMFQKLNLRIKNAGEKTGIKQKIINKYAFSIWSNEMAYWLGFIAADGSIHKYKPNLCIELKSSDNKQLSKFLKFIDADGIKIHYYERTINEKVKKSCCINVYSEKIKQDLSNFGIVPKKSYKDIDFLSFVPNECKLAFIIGYFDGDGSISNVNKHKSFLLQFSGNYLLLNSIKDYFLKLYNFNNVKIKEDKRSNVYELCWGSKKDISLFKELYVNHLPEDLLLERKLEVFKSNEFNNFVNREITNTKKQKSPIKVDNCIVCGCELKRRFSTKTKRCVQCYRNSTRRVERPSKEILLKLITTKSFLQIGNEYGVSDNAIRKWCKSYDLPTKKKDLKSLTLL